MQDVDRHVRVRLYEYDRFQVHEQGRQPQRLACSSDRLTGEGMRRITLVRARGDIVRHDGVGTAAHSIPRSASPATSSIRMPQPFVDRSLWAN
jgi:hypothetical protein